MEVLFLLQFHGGFGLSLEEPPFAQMETTINGALAKGDIVLFGSGEVGEGGGPRFRGNDAEVARDTPCEKDAGFCFPVGNDLFHIGCGDEGLHDDLGLGGSGDEIEVFDDFFSAAEAAPDFRFLDGGTFFQMGEQDLCGRKGIAEAVEFAVGGTAGDGLEEVGGGFFPEAVEGSETTVLAGGGECGKILDAQFFPQGSKLFGAKAGEVKEGKKARGNGSTELLEVGEFSGGHQGGDFFAQGFADAGKFAEAVRPNEFPQVGWGGFERACGGEISPALEGVLSLKL